MIPFEYTAELRSFFENLPANADTSIPHRQVIENGRKELFDFDYPIFDENYRKVFETHFIRNFYIRQVGFETFGLFKFQLETWLLVNMPYYNKLFESELLEYDPLTNSKVDVVSNKKNDKRQNDTKNIFNQSNRTGLRTTNDTSKMTGTSESETTRNDTGSVTDNSFNRELESNTPDNRLAITTNDGAGIIEYASNIKEHKDTNTKNTEVDGTENSSQSSTVNNTNTGTANVSDNSTDNKNETHQNVINDVEDFIQHRIGKIGVQSYAKMVQDYRAALLRIEKQIFNEMNELFMLVY